MEHAVGLEAEHRRRERIARASQLLEELAQRLAAPNRDCALRTRFTLYPEERTTSRPTAEQILSSYSLTQRNVVSHNDVDVHAFEPELTDLQEHVLDLLGVPASRYRPDA